MAQYVEINPDMLRWAVDRSGVPVEDFKQPVEKWLTEKSKPTFSMLEAFAKKAMVPFGYLFLSNPPEEKLPVPDYRTRTDDGVPRPSPNLWETIFDMQRRQDWMSEYLSEEGHGDLEFVGTTRIGQNIPEVANRIRKTLQLEQDWARHTKSIEDALRHLRERIEEAGILIFINGIIGNNTSRALDPEEFQGFVLPDSVAPLVFVNGADYKAAQMFTIAHELAHVWIGKGALFGDLATNSANERLEKYCNAVAAELLVPASLLKSGLAANKALDSNDYQQLSRYFRVSPIVIARRTQEVGFITSDEFFRFYNQYTEQLQKAPIPKKSGGNFWSTQNTRLGKRFGRAVISAAAEGRLSYSDAYDLTRLYGKTFDKYARLLSDESRP